MFILTIKSLKVCPQILLICNYVFNFLFFLLFELIVFGKFVTQNVK